MAAVERDERAVMFVELQERRGITQVTISNKHGEHSVTASFRTEEEMTRVGGLLELKQ